MSLSKLENNNTVKKQINKKSSIKKSSSTSKSKNKSKNKSNFILWSWKNLVIVESPAKARTIKKFLWKDFDIVASMWHIVDLPKKWFWIDIEKKFKPTYEVMPDKKKVVSDLKKLSKSYNKVWIATDEDREWEAIAWHILNSLKLNIAETPRIVFHEITKDALLWAINNPRQIDINLVNSQQARRILDRLVGFKVSPVLWSKIKRWLSAGRVQSVAVKLIVEKENEIKAFIPKESWKLSVDLNSSNWNITAILDKVDNKKVDFKFREDVLNFFLDYWIVLKEELLDEKNNNIILLFENKSEFILEWITNSNSKKTPSAPFITSTLQQAASNKFWWGVKQVMMIAQKLYENWFITYMRTDSVNLSDDALSACEKFIWNSYWKWYVKKRKFSTKSKSAQEAHEAIRPTNIMLIPSASWLSSKELSLYTLIWVRTLASQMSDAIFENTTYKFSPKYSKSQSWISKWQTMKFDWFYKLYKDFLGSYPTNDQIIPSYNEWDILNSINYTWTQLFSKPPSRYSESSLVKKLEELWIWRPSTYAPTISTIIDRWYVEKDDWKRLFPTDIAFVVNSFLEKNFNSLMDYKFTAWMESLLDDISNWNIKWQVMLSDFWEKFVIDLDKAVLEKKEDVLVGKKCPKCSSELVYKFSKTWKFIWCSSYPDCTYIEQTKEDKSKLDDLREKYEWKPCPDGWTIVVKVWRFWPFLASSEYPKVKWISKIPDERIIKLEEKFWWTDCDKCSEWKMIVKNSRRWPFLACSRYPDCKNAKNLPKNSIDN